MQGNYKIAGHVVRIDSVLDDVHSLCSDYQTEEEPEFLIKTSQEDMESEKEAAAKEYTKEKLPAAFIADGVYESMAVYRKLTEYLFAYDILLFHGSVVSVDGNGYMFIAISGTGKSTHSRMWRELFGARAVMVNDDKPLVEIRKGITMVYGTPWNGKHHIGNNISVPLKAICILKRGLENRIEAISIAEAYPMLLQQIHRIPDKDKLLKTMSLIDTMAENVAFYTMECNISTDAAKLAYQVMSEGEVKNETEGLFCDT